MKRKLGIFDWFSYDLPFEDRLSLIRNAGFETVMLWWDNADSHPELARQVGLDIANIHVPFEDAGSIWLDDLAGDDYLNLLLSAVEACARHQIPAAVIHTHQSRKAPVLTDVGLDRFKRLADAAERLSVNLALENLRYIEPLEYLFNNIKSPCLGFCFDTGHRHCYTPAYDWLSAFGDRLFAVHIADNNGDVDAHLLPFDGSVDWQKLIDGLKHSRPLEYLTLEADFNRSHPDSKRYENLPPHAFLERAHARLTRLSTGFDEESST